MKLKYIGANTVVFKNSEKKFVKLFPDVEYELSDEDFKKFEHTGLFLKTDTDIVEKTDDIVKAKHIKKK